MRIALILFVIFMISVVSADDGMWMPHQMKNLNLQEVGLKMNPAELYKMDGTGLMSAIVYLGGGTGEFVSPDGLILTNHHVAFGALQRAATPEMDYLEKGFLANSREAEIPAPGYIADVLLRYEDITDRIVPALLEEMSPFEKHKMIERLKKEIIAQAEKNGPDIHCRIADMYSGNQYFPYTFKRLPDVRIVYAPPRDLGNFGGDIDNWMWPRHTADFTFLRAYVSTENTGVEYSPDNVPYRPKSFLKLSRRGINEGDFTFVMGYPGRTYRNYTVSELRSDIQRMEKRIQQFEDIITFYKNAGKDNKAVELKYARKVRGLNNALKNYRGKLEGFQKNKILMRAEEKEQQFIKLFQEAGKTAALESLKALDEFIQSYNTFDDEYQIYNSLVSPYYGPALLAQAHLIVRAVLEKEKDDLDRDELFQTRNEIRLRSRIKLAERGYDLNTDKLYFKQMLIKILDTPGVSLEQIFENLSRENVNEFVERVYNNSQITDSEKRLNYINLSLDELQNLSDPLIDLSVKVETKLAQFRDARDAKSQEREDLKKVYQKALFEINEGHFAADANGTIRFTYGNIEGYKPRDAVRYLPQTTLKGVIDKNTGEFPFRVPPQLTELYQHGDFGTYIDEQLNDVPVCFLNTTNVTGGNSGSPTLNAQGEQIGIIFDMTYESVIGDYYIIPELQRTISVDILYVLFITDKFAGARHIIEELEIMD